jgi:SSS family solute:Na+ symporter
VLTIPITGTFFSKRTWLLGKRYGFRHPGRHVRLLFQRAAAFSGRFNGGSLLDLLLGGAADGVRASCFNVIAGVPVTFGAIFMAFIVWFYVCTGGLKASTWVGVIQFVLLVGGIIILGFFVITAPEFGGWTGFSTSGQSAWTPSSSRCPGDQLRWTGRCTG